MLFTAHSLPEKALAPGDPYDRETRATAAAVAARLGLRRLGFRLSEPGDDQTTHGWAPLWNRAWTAYAAEGVRDVVIDPIGFVCDHVEVLFDIDVLFREYAAERGIELVRPESLNGSPAFTEALARVAERCLGTIEA